MCGIFAAFNIEDCEFSESDFVKSTEIVRHRGPDNLGYYGNENCFLGHTRLSIVGLGQSGNQPFHFESLVMVYNGEIYNFHELREELIQLGYTFETHCDTEVVIKSFHKWGSNCFSKFNGMWALAIYDHDRKVLTASRDRFGQKPLFVMKEGGTIYLASEVQQLMRFSRREIDYGLIQMFLKEGTFDDRGRTFFKSIEVFPKAHSCEFDGKSACTSFRYWDYWDGEVRKVEESCLEEFSDLFKDAVRLRLRTDVPFSVLLSGGVDSTLVAAYASEFDDSNNTIPAFTYSSRDADDETEYAKEVAQRLGMEITVREQDQVPEEYTARLRRLVKHLGRGHAAPCIVPIDYLYESVAEAGIKVAIDGQGADELLAGYRNYYLLAIFVFLFKGRIGQALRFSIEMFRTGFLPTVILYMRNIMPEPAKKIMRRIYGYERLFTKYSESHKEALVKRHVVMRRNKNALNRYLIPQHDLGLESLLYYGDIVSMNNSVENRSPFMDYRLEETYQFSVIDR